MCSVFKVQLPPGPAVGDITHGRKDKGRNDDSSSLPTPQPDPYTGPFDAAFHDEIMSILTPGRATLDLFYTLPPWVLEGEAIPMSYVRHQIPSMGPTAWMNLDSASHLLQLQPASSRSPVELFPVHDVFLLSQCAHMHQISTVVTHNALLQMPTLLVHDMPHSQTFKLLLWWLYFNDEEDLVDQLQDMTSPQELHGFAENARYLGVVHLGILRAMEAAIKSKRL